MVIVKFLSPSRSKIRFKKFFHVILEPESHPNSWASYLLLKNELTRGELKSRFQEQKKYTKFRRKLLRSIKTIEGQLKCHYCKNVVFEKHEKLENQLTLDHIIPLSKGGERSSSTNVLVSCAHCNKRRGNMDYRDFCEELVAA
jgi:hypothetical protein